MQNLNGKSIVEFRRKSPVGKRNFVERLKSAAVLKTTSKTGGDYWVSALSSIGDYIKEGKKAHLEEKIEIIEEKLKKTKHPPTLIQFSRNIDLLNAFYKFELKKLLPSVKIRFIKHSGKDQILTIKGFQVKSLSNYVHVFEDTKTNTIGAIRLIAVKDEYQLEELEIFAELTFRFLDKYYAKTHKISAELCIAIDVERFTLVSNKSVSTGKKRSMLESTLNEISRML